MLKTLKSIIVLNTEMAAQVVTADEFANAKAAHKKNKCAPMIPVRLTLNSDGEFVSMTRTDKAITPMNVGSDPVTEGDNTTVDALMTPILAGGFGLRSGDCAGNHVQFQILPFVTPENGWTGYVNEHFRLRTEYLPCRENQPRDAYNSMMHGEARINVQTQTVVHLDVIEPGQEKAPIGTLIQDIPATDSEPHMIVVTCYLANGGCCFERAIR